MMTREEFKAYVLANTAPAQDLEGYGKATKFAKHGARKTSIGGAPPSLTLINVSARDLIDALDSGGLTSWVTPVRSIWNAAQSLQHMKDDEFPVDEIERGREVLLGMIEYLSQFGSNADSDRWIAAVGAHHRSFFEHGKSLWTLPAEASAKLKQQGFFEDNGKSMWTLPADAEQSGD